MKAFILAAGLGTRLSPITDTRPKALAEVGGKSLLEICIRSLQRQGIEEFIVNTHHFAEQIDQHLHQHHNFGARVQVVHERELLLDTGGGIQHIAPYLQGESHFVVHNVDVVSDLLLGPLVQQHIASHNLATLAVRQRPSSRYFEFDAQGLLCGWRNTTKDQYIAAREPLGSVQPLAFSGIHVLSTRIFELLHETAPFSIVTAYLRLAATERIAAYDHSAGFWRDLGRVQHLHELQQEAPQIDFLHQILST